MIELTEVLDNPKDFDVRTNSEPIEGTRDIACTIVAVYKYNPSVSFERKFRLQSWMTDSEKMDHIKKQMESIKEFIESGQVTLDA